MRKDRKELKDFRKGYRKNINKKTIKKTIIEESLKTNSNLDNIENHFKIINDANIINLTNHNVLEINSGIKYPTSDRIFRVENSNKRVMNINGSPVKKGLVKAIEGVIPEEKENTFYIVSTMALKKLKMDFPDRNDFISPGPINYKDQTITTGKGQNKKTRIIKIKHGCNGFFNDYEELDAYKELKRLKERLKNEY